ncbi:MAG: hypothetical protein QOK23_260 [Gammaproteobacteria bacterium]|jgi:hypothetical protein|nr:lipoprotein [Gammaproteobacteria bacterium]MEA3138091.1 hypothetical protein [Gammaproteobacteria bacterium]
MHPIKLPICVLVAAWWLAGCAGEKPTVAPTLNPVDAHALIEQSLPRYATDRAGWATDIYSAFTVLTVSLSRENVCAVVAVIEQESSFRVDPAVPNLGVIARKEINTRAAQAHVPSLLVDGVLQLKSTDGRSYGERIDAAKTEKDLSDAYEDFIAGVPLGRTLFADRNPIRTRGPMQVNVNFAEQFSSSAPYPYPVKTSIADELFTRRGSVYFGTAHLLNYRAPYDKYLYRFADFNAGQYASRNAAFQNAAAIATGVPLIPDGALLTHEGDANKPGATETALRTLAGRLKLSEGAIHSALAEGKTKGFEKTTLYQRVFEMADQTSGSELPRALVPRIQLGGPKIKRKLTTDWYAHRVDDRFKRCLNAK